MKRAKKVAVFFGGPSLEHDISVLTGLQVIEAMDYAKYIPIPVYVDLQSVCWTGDALLNRKNYYLSQKVKSSLSRVELPFGNPSLEPELRIRSRFGLGKQELPFDCAFVAFHGNLGEDGAMQGVFEAMQIPHTGCRLTESAVFMNKVLTKRWCRGLGINVLPDKVIAKTQFRGAQDVDAIVRAFGGRFPLCAKPCHLGSSIGVYRVEDAKELEAALLTIFRMDFEALVEPFIESLEEYNVAITRAFGDVRLSAIERPLRKGEILDFKDKYLAEGNADSKLSASHAQGMAGASREICPKNLSPEMAQKIRDMATSIFTNLESVGSPRIDFLSDTKTGEIWLNEVNPLPGSLAYYLWERAQPEVKFAELIDALIAEGFREFEKRQTALEPRLVCANIFNG